MKREIDVKPTVGEEVIYVPEKGPVIVVTIEKVLDNETIDGVRSGPARTHTPQRFSNLKHNASGAPNTWCFSEEASAGRLHERPAVTAPATPWQGKSRWQRKQEATAAVKGEHEVGK